MRYFVKSGSKVDCLMGCAKEETEISWFYYIWLKIFGYCVFKRR